MRDSTKPLVWSLAALSLGLSVHVSAAPPAQGKTGASAKGASSVSSATAKGAGSVSSAPAKGAEGTPASDPAVATAADEKSPAAPADGKPTPSVPGDDAPKATQGPVTSAAPATGSSGSKEKHESPPPSQESSGGLPLMPLPYARDWGAHNYEKTRGWLSADLGGGAAFDVADAAATTVKVSNGTNVALGQGVGMSLRLRGLFHAAGWLSFPFQLGFSSTDLAASPNLAYRVNNTNLSTGVRLSYAGLSYELAVSARVGFNIHSASMSIVDGGQDPPEQQLAWAGIEALTGGGAELRLFPIARHREFSLGVFGDQNVFLGGANEASAKTLKAGAMPKGTRMQTSVGLSVGLAF